MTAGWHPASRSVLQEGRALHLVDLGTGDTPLLLVHGYLMSSYMWRENLEVLSRERRVVAPCLPGFGWSDVGEGPYDVESQALALVGLMDELEIDRAHLAGHSMGGAICLWLARHRPERVDRLVLVDALAIKGTLPKVPWGVVRSGLAPVYRKVVRPRLARMALERYAYGSIRVDGDYMEHFLVPLRRPGAVEAALTVARELRQMAPVLDEQLERVEPETLVVWGDSDRLLPLRVGKRLHDRLPRARIEVFERCGHSPHEERPDRFNQVVSSFLSPA